MKRADGRGPEDLRDLRLTRRFQPNPAGSCLIELGATRVVCAATVEEDVPRWMRGAGKGWVTAEYSMLPSSTAERSPREIKSGRPSGRTQEIQRLIGRSLRAVTDMEALGERSIIVDCDVLVADGGTRTASITGAYVALAEAIQSLGLRVPKVLVTEVAAVSVGVIGGVPVLDLDYSEDAGAEVDMNVVMTGAGGLVEVQGTAEGAPFDRDLLDRMLDLATAGIGRLVEAQRATLAL
ncbi:MAG TPA: ribonuclease PH [Actinomycetota bacterium]|nr:ribonuclease PH [Actinomycetota bacterium]